MTISLPESLLIDAIVPVYTDQGDDSLILTRSGNIIHYPLKASSIIKKLAKRDCISIPALQYTTSRLLSHTGHLPLRFSDNLLLVPLKMRSPRLKTDRGYGYINYFAFCDSTADGSDTLIETDGGHLIPILWSYKTTTMHLNNAHTVDRALRQNTPLLKLLLPLVTTICGLKPSSIIK